MGVTTSSNNANLCFIGDVSLRSFNIGYVVSLAVGLILETVLFWVSLRGTILETAPRVSVQYILYIRLGKVLLVTPILNLEANWDQKKKGGKFSSVTEILIEHWIISCIAIKDNLYKYGNVPQFIGLSIFHNWDSSWTFFPMQHKYLFS